MRSNLDAMLRLIALNSDNVLGLTEVCRVAISVKTSHNEATSGSTAVFPGDQRKVDFVVNTGKLDESVDDGSAERCVLDILVLAEHVMVEGELLHVIQAIWVHVYELGHLQRAGACVDQFDQSALNAFGQVQVL